MVQAVGPFIQQIISQEYVQTSVGTGSLPVAVNVGQAYSLVQETQPGIIGTYDKPVNMPTSAAFYSGLFTNQSVDYNSSIQPNCGTTNCTWSESYMSLGVCRSCADLTQYITHWYYNETGDRGYDPALNFTLANGHSLQTSSNITSIPFMNVTTHTSSLAFANTSGILLDFSVLTISPYAYR